MEVRVLPVPQLTIRTTNRTEHHTIAAPSTPLDHALLAAEQGLKVFLLPPLAKSPPPKGWQELATNDPAEIARLFAAKPRSNYGIPTGLDNNLYVIDLDGPVAQNWFRSTGIMPSDAKVITPSGPERAHHYFRIEDVALPNTQGGKPSDETPVTTGLAFHVDTRGEGGYVVGPGSITRDGSYQGDLSNIPDLPPELLALIPEKQEYVSEDFGGQKPETASEEETRKITWVIEQLQALPRVWVEGAGWRSTAFGMGCWLSRMANTSSYALTQDDAWQILQAHTPTDDQWGQRELLEQWQSAIKSTVDQYAKAPSEAMPNLLSWLSVGNLLDGLTSDGRNFMEMVDAEVDGGETSTWKRRRYLLAECFRRGMSVEQAGTVIWNSESGKPLGGDPNGQEILWREVEAARAAHETSQIVPEAPSADERPPLVLSEAPSADDRVELLTPEERALVEADVEWFGARYIEWVRSKVAALNMPYHRMSIWLALSLRFADVGFIPLPTSPVAPNFFAFQGGPTTSGKTEAMKLFRSLVRAMFPQDSPIISANASENALYEHLFKRDGKSTLLNNDEASGMLRNMNTPGHWQAGLADAIIGLFDGDVQMMLRTGKSEFAGKEAKSFFLTNFVGTIDGLSDALDEKFWVSGWGPRSIWAIGKRIDDPNADVAVEVEGYSAEAYDAMPKQWAAEFNSRRDELKKFGTLPLAINSAKDGSLERQTQLQKTLTKIAKGHPQHELLRPTLIRLGTTIWKAAILVAMSEGSNVVTLRHRLIAIEAGEEWLNNILFMVAQTTASTERREIDKLELFIARQRNEMARPEAIYRWSNKMRWETDKSIDQLKVEGRIVSVDLPGPTAAKAWQINRAAAA